MPFIGTISNQNLAQNGPSCRHMRKNSCLVRGCFFSLCPWPPICIVCLDESQGGPKFAFHLTIALRFGFVENGGWVKLGEKLLKETAGVSSGTYLYKITYMDTHLQIYNSNISENI